MSLGLHVHVRRGQIKVLTASYTVPLDPHNISVHASTSCARLGTQIAREPDTKLGASGASRNDS